MININFRDSRPIYEQIKDFFCQMILSGALTADEKMPSVRELASSLSINPNTIQRAYKELEAEGYICSVLGKGSFVCGSTEALNAKKAELKREFVSRVHELKEIGFTEEELIAIVKGEDGND